MVSSRGWFFARGALIFGEAGGGVMKSMSDETYVLNLALVLSFQGSSVLSAGLDITTVLMGHLGDASERGCRWQCVFGRRLDLFRQAPKAGS